MVLSEAVSENVFIYLWRWCLSMVRYMIEFRYIGTKYKGLQKLPKFEGDTVQGILDTALEKLKPKNEIKTVTCSRTDRGVHALMNAVHVDLEHRISGEVFKPHEITERMNTYLKSLQHDIVVSRSRIVPDLFHVRHCAKSRSYIYRLAILNADVPSTELPELFLPVSEKHRSHIVHGPLDISRIQDNLKLFIGTHDYSTFTKCLNREKRDPVRRVDELTFSPLTCTNSMFDPSYRFVNMWQFYIKGDSFLYHQVRKMVGTILSLGYGYTSSDDVREMFRNPTPDKWRKAKLPPPDGLYLADIQFL